MKQRKPPYVLGGILLVALCAVVFIGLRFVKEGLPLDPDQPLPTQQTQPDTPVGPSHDVPDPKTMAGKVEQTSKGKMGEAAVPPPTGPRQPPPMPAGESIRTGPAVEQKPAPSENATRSQWW